MNGRDRHQARFGERDQSFRNHLSGRVRFFLIGRFLQIESSAKRGARATQN